MRRWWSWWLTPNSQDRHVWSEFAYWGQYSDQIMTNMDLHCDSTALNKSTLGRSRHHHGHQTEKLKVNYHFSNKFHCWLAIFDLDCRLLDGWWGQGGKREQCRMQNKQNTVLPNSFATLLQLLHLFLATVQLFCNFAAFSLLWLQAAPSDGRDKTRFLHSSYFHKLRNKTFINSWW